MAKKQSKEKAAKEGKTLVLYVEDSTPHSKLFDTRKKAENFVKKYNKENPNVYDGYWVDYLISDIKGEIVDYELTRQI